MSEFLDMVVDMLPLHSALQRPDNPLRIVLDRSIGEYMDATGDVFDQLFLTSATGSWLDCHGKDYGVLRKIDEDDESYRERIIQEKNDRLTPSYLAELYGLDLYAYVSDFDPSENTLTSDNPYSSNRYMSIASSDIQGILNSKFVLGGELTWL